MDPIALVPIPKELDQENEYEWEEGRGLHALSVRWEERYVKELQRVTTISHFVTQSLLQDEVLQDTLPDMLTLPSRSSGYLKRLNHLLTLSHNEQDGYKVLRQFRRREMVYIAWRDITLSWSITESLQHLSELAEAMIMATYHWQYKQCCDSWGTPCNEQGESQSMIILGMGKLGGRELNFSSDIDLIFAYPESGETQGARRTLDNAQFFTRLGQRVIKALDMQTMDGFCYRVDMRLRPFGDSGPLVMSFAALEGYYQEQGREWERYAMIKARPMGDEDSPEYQDLRAMLKPFVFRRYIDFSAIESLRSMKSMIRSEVRRRRLDNNIKLGAGGIREIEFIAQAFQLIRGGRDIQLQNRGLLETLDAIEELSLLEKQEVSALKEGYCYLRRVENILQAMDDKQTQLLPDDDNSRLKLAIAMGDNDWEAFQSNLAKKMVDIHYIFDGLIDEEEEKPSLASVYKELWDMAYDREVLEQILSGEVPSSHAIRDASLIAGFQDDITKKSLGPKGREVLNRLMPYLLQAVYQHPEAEFGLPRVLHLLMHIVTRTAYLQLLYENLDALKQLIRLCTASPMISTQLARYPILLDELLDPYQLYHPFSCDQYTIELRDFLARIPEDDMEQQMEALRQFKQVCMLRIAAGDVAGVLPVMQVSDHLTSLAEAIIGTVVNQAWKQMSEKYGEPIHLKDRRDKGFSAVAYGKMGGRELAYQSDLDVVFLHDCPANSYTDGRKNIDSRQFYLRLAQRIIHLFSTRTPSGVLYELDMRLRPSGVSGLLVCDVHAYAEYQEKEAWTWEHQALVRARVVVGEGDIVDQFNRIRRHILSQQREENVLKDQVASMREKMRSHLGEKKAGRFMLKQDPGGITDIEFIAQYLVLNHSHLNPSVAKWSDNIRIFESMEEANILLPDQASCLNHAYTTMRNEIHHRNLLELSADLAEGKLHQERESIRALWQHIML
ncbi:bifunctional [glutamate--ammonia ligase]-adenylyl-L-tyrosine phosphorylase/[glutamate--ammonia-ligase] adenylyltransferase [Vibrio sp.]|nr:bifunctional [glutamate--ammonia ligase]-adenylyl-L-tyrosine phosphorylase/[glutamate--ammonia-ligase] adenylyltransferase [Vibrio sp.]